MNRKKSPQKTDHRVGGRIDGLVRRKKDLPTGQDEENPEKNRNPGDLQQHRTQGDENDPKKKSAENAIKENSVLILRRDGKEIEDHDKDKDVVHRQRLLHHKAGQKFQRGLPGRHRGIKTRDRQKTRIVSQRMVGKEIESKVEEHGQSDPDHAPSRRLPQTHLMRLPMEYP